MSSSQEIIISSVVKEDKKALIEFHRLSALAKLRESIHHSDLTFLSISVAVINTEMQPVDLYIVKQFFETHHSLSFAFGRTSEHEIHGIAKVLVKSLLEFSSLFENHLNNRLAYIDRSPGSFFLRVLFCGMLDYVIVSF